VLQARLEERTDRLQKSEHEAESLRRELSDVNGDLRRRLVQQACEIGRATPTDGSRVNDAHGSGCALPSGLKRCKPEVDSDSEVALQAASGIKVGSGRPCCFHMDAEFVIRAGDGIGEMTYRMKARDLSKGSRVVAADPSGTLVEVSRHPEIYEVDEMILIKAGGASLLVSPEHTVPAKCLCGPELETDVKAEDLRVEQHQVLVNSKACAITSVEHIVYEDKEKVVKISFHLDLPVEAIMPPSAIATKGFNRKAPRRSRMNQRLRSQVKFEEEEVDASSVPPVTATGSEDQRLPLILNALVI